jgi:hypothetical protein
MEFVSTLDPGNKIKQTFKRKQSLVNEIRRLKVRLQVLESRQRSWSWWRLVVFSLGVIATYIGMIFGGMALGVVIMVVSLFAFSLVVWWYRRLGKGIDRLHTWQEMRKGQIARMNLDWKRYHIHPSPIYLMKPLPWQLTSTWWETARSIT